MADQYTLQDPRRMHADRVGAGQSQQQESRSGLGSGMTDQPHLGEDSYRGSARLAGRRALITGGDSGIGGATAIAFAREGADVALSYLPEEQEDAEHIAAVVRDAGRSAVLLPGDLTDPDYCRELVERSAAGLGGLDALVHVAGTQRYRESLADLDDAQLDRTFRTNVYSIVWITRAALPLLRPGSTVVTTTSIQAYFPSPSLVDYAATKGAINNLTKGLAAQLAPRGIRVNSVAPGPIWSPLQVASGFPDDALDGPQGGLGRWGQPSEVAPAYVFLTSAESSFVSGETLNVNGGAPTP